MIWTIVGLDRSQDMNGKKCFKHGSWVWGEEPKPAKSEKQQPVRWETNRRRVTESQMGAVLGEGSMINSGKCVYLPLGKTL
jgi:hypothetical protein